MSASKYRHRNDEKNRSFKFDDSDRTFPAKMRSKLGKKAQRKMYAKGKAIEEEKKKCPSLEFIPKVVERCGKSIPSKGKVMGGYSVLPKSQKYLK